MRFVFADTSGLVALNNRRDDSYRLAQEKNKQLLHEKCTYITTNYVLDESYTLLLFRVSHHAAVDFGERIKESSYVRLIHITDAIEEEAWDIFKSFGDKRFSFTDCTSFAVMKQYSIDRAFTNDHHFEQMGFTILLK
jgi:uncharacterized protein